MAHIDFDNVGKIRHDETSEADVSDYELVNHNDGISLELFRREYYRVYDSLSNNIERSVMELSFYDDGTPCMNVYEISEALNIKPKKVSDIQKLIFSKMGSFAPVKVVIAEDAMKPNSYEVQFERAVSNKNFLKEFEFVKSQLSDLDRNILDLSFWDDGSRCMTVKQIAKALAIKEAIVKQRRSQIYKVIKSYPFMKARAKEIF